MFAYFCFYSNKNFSSFLQSHNTRSQRGEKEKEKDKQPDVHLDSDEEIADADLSLMNRTKRLAKEKAAKAADLRRQLAELEDPEDSPVDSDIDPDQVQDHSSKDMGAFVAAAVSLSFHIYLNLSKATTSSMFFWTMTNPDSILDFGIDSSLFYSIKFGYLRPRSTCQHVDPSKPFRSFFKRFAIATLECFFI